jgi:hypothetical protein
MLAPLKNAEKAISKRAVARCRLEIEAAYMATPVVQRAKTIAKPGPTTINARSHLGVLSWTVASMAGTHRWGPTQVDV